MKRYTTVFFVLLFCGAVFLPMTAQAGFFDFISNLFKGRENFSLESKASTLNSQTAPILKAVLNHDPNPAKGGGDITIVGGSALVPDAGPLGTIADIDEYKQYSSQISIYVVREGDSLSQIAEMFNVSVNTIIWSNNIKRGSLIKPGETLVILPITGVQHTVAKGDTLQSIAKKYKGNFDEIVNYNGIDAGSTLSVGSVITVPDGEVATPVVSYTRTASGSGGPEYVGYYLRPLVGGIRTQGLHGYNGVDIAAPAGTPILASASGSVIVSRNTGWSGGYGKYTVIKHKNGTQTLYAHANKIITYVGQSVVQGQVIGYVGNTGRSTGSHLHFEIRGAKNPF